VDASIGVRSDDPLEMDSARGFIPYGAQRKEMQMSLFTTRTAMASMLAAALLATAAAADAAPPRYRMMLLGPLGSDSDYVQAFDINNAGQVLVAGPESYVWQRGMVTPLAQAGVRAINGRGWITGIASSGQAFLYRNHQYETWGASDAVVGEDVNDLGTVVGSSYNYPDAIPAAFVHRDGVTSGLPWAPGVTPVIAKAVNNRDQVTGTLGIGSVVDSEFEGYHAFVYKGGELIDINPGADFRSFGEGINDRGDVVGSAYSPTRWQRAFLYRGGVLKFLGSLGAPRNSSSWANAVNQSGVVVGGVAIEGLSTGRFRAFVYTGGRMFDLNALTPWRNGFMLEQALAINDRGVIVGSGSYRLGGGESRAFVLRPVANAAARDTSQSTD
jgi:probable HAF family extracellular repeat protein